MNTALEEPTTVINPKDVQFNTLISHLQDAGYQLDTQEYNRLRREFDRGTYKETR
jgi:hypothetical protein